MEHTTQEDQMTAPVPTKPKPPKPLFLPGYPMPLALTVPQAGYLLGFSSSEIYIMMYKEQLPSIKHGKTRRIALKDVEAWIEARRAQAEVERDRWRQ